jgi:F-box domain
MTCIACGEDALYCEQGNVSNTFCNALCQYETAYIGDGLDELPCDLLLIIVSNLDPADYKAMRLVAKKLKRCIDADPSNPRAQTALLVLRRMMADEMAQLAAVRRTGYAIQHIENPSEQVQLAAVQQTGDALRYIKNPSEQVQLAAVRRTGYVLEHIKNPSEQIQLAAVQQTGHALQYIKNPSEQVQLAAVQQTGYALQYIKNPSEQIQLAAVQQTEYALHYLKNPSEHVLSVANSRKKLRVRMTLQ